MNTEIDKKLLRKIRLHYGGRIIFGNDRNIVPEELTHDYLLNNFSISTAIKEYYYSCCADLLGEEDYKSFVSKGYVGNQKTTLKPFPFVYNGAYIVRKQLYYRLSDLSDRKLKYNGKIIKYLENLCPYFDDYQEGFEVGYNNFKSDCIEKFLPMFPDRSDFVNKVFEYVTKEIIFVHSWKNNHFGFTVSFVPGSIGIENGEIINAFEDGKTQGYFYRAWSEIFSNNNLFKELFENLISSKTNVVSILEDILEASYKMQQNKVFYNSDEDTRTRQILDLMPSIYQTKDQSHYGKSLIGIKPGSVDGVITFQGVEYFLEAFNLSYLNRGVIKNHIDKLERNYDSRGLKEKFVLVYYNLEDHKFDIEAEKYRSYLKDDHKFKFELTKIENLETKYANSRMFKSYHKREGIEVVLYHILLKFPLL